MAKRKKVDNDFRITNFGLNDVTGSSILLEIESEGLRILLDYGMFQSNAHTIEDVYRINKQKLRVPIEDLTHIVILHSHNDHIGSLGLIGNDEYGFSGKIIGTHLCNKLGREILLDSAHIMSSEVAQYNATHKCKLSPLYAKENVENVVSQMRGYGYEIIRLSDNCTLELIPSAHLPGGAMALITLEKEYGRKKTLLYTSDLYFDKVNNTKKAFTKSVPNRCLRPNVVCIESTYGDRIREPKDSLEQLEKYIMDECVGKNRILFLSTFAQHRATDLIYMIDKIFSKNKSIADKNIPVYVCSSLLKRCHDIILDDDSEEFYDDEWKGLQHLREPKGFTFLTTGKDVETRVLNNSMKIVIASSGMLNAGFANMIAKSYIPNTKVSLCLTGYSGEGTLARELLEGKEYVTIQQLTRKVRCKILEPLQMSCHADQNGLVDFIKSCDGRKLNKVLIIHGNDESREALKERLDCELCGKSDVEVFKANSRYKF